MKLAGKAEADFKIWLLKNRNEVILDGKTEYDLYYVFTYIIPETCQNALIIEWLDTKKYRGIPLFEHSFALMWRSKTDLMSFNDVAVQAIEVSSIIYNECSGLLKN